MPRAIVPRETDEGETVEQPITERARARHALLALADAATARGDHELAAMAPRLRDMR